MISFDKALDIIRTDAFKRLEAERVSLQNSLGRILCSDIISRSDIPFHDISGVDGFALKAEDVDKKLKIMETVPAGKRPRREIKTGECCRIMTGAWVPDGADTVVMIEHTLVEGRYVKVIKPGSKSNIRKAGEEIASGEMVLRRGTPVSPAIIAVLAAMKIDPVPVYRQPRVGIISTGNEIIKPSSPKTGPFIPDSNGYQLYAQVKECCAIPKYYGIKRDDPEKLKLSINKGLKECDVLLISGGVSAGDFDYVPSVLRNCGVFIRFHRVKIKPGKPALFGTNESCNIFGLPGNPVSAFVVFYFFVKPLLFELMGHEYAFPIFSGVSDEEIGIKQSGKVQFIPVHITATGIKRVDSKGSAHIHAMCGAHGLILAEAGTGTITEGSAVKVFLTQQAKYAF